MNYCTKCAQKMSDDAMRCSACHHFSGLFWLTLFNSAGWIIFVALVYVVFARFTPAVWRLLAASGSMISQPWFIQMRLSNVIVSLGRIFADLVVVLVLAAAVASREFPRFRKVLAPFLCVGLLSMTALVFADFLYMGRIALDVEGVLWRFMDLRFESKGLDATRQVIAAEYRYRELHPKAGFTCDFEPLEALGGPAKAVYRGAKSGKGILDVNGYVLYLSQCTGNPVSHYQLAAVAGGNESTLHNRAFCSDGSNIVYAAEDGKAKTCLETRQPLP